MRFPEGVENADNMRSHTVLLSTRPRAPPRARAYFSVPAYTQCIGPKLVLSITPEPAQKIITPQIKAHDELYHLHTLVQTEGQSPGGGALR